MGIAKRGKIGKDVQDGQDKTLGFVDLLEFLVGGWRGEREEEESHAEGAGNAEEEWGFVVAWRSWCVDCIKYAPAKPSRPSNAEKPFAAFAPLRFLLFILAFSLVEARQRLELVLKPQLGPQKLQYGEPSARRSIPVTVTGGEAGGCLRGFQVSKTPEICIEVNS